MVFKSLNFMVTHTIWRFVKFPMLGERVPDRFWLGVPLKQKTTSKNSKNFAQYL